MRAIKELQKIGFRLDVFHGKIRFYWNRDGEPVPKCAAPLIDVVRKDKEKALRFLQGGGDPFRIVFLDAVHDVNERYVWGTLEHIERSHPDRYSRIREAQARLDEVWGSGPRRETAMEDFKAVLDEWRSLHLEAIEIFTREHLNRKTIQEPQRERQPSLFLQARNGKTSL